MSRLYLSIHSSFLEKSRPEPVKSKNPMVETVEIGTPKRTLAGMEMDISLSKKVDKMKVL